MFIQSNGKDYCPIVGPGEALNWFNFSTVCWIAGGETFAAGTSIESVRVASNGDGIIKTSTGFHVTNMEVF